MSVSIQPGRTALQRTRGPWSIAIERVRACTKAFEALYSALERSATTPEIEPMLTMTPPCSVICGSTARLRLNTPRQLTPTWRSQSSSVDSATVLATRTPALFTSKETGP